MKIRLATWLLVCASFTANMAGASTLYSNFGAGNSYNTGSGWLVGDPYGEGAGWMHSFSFVAAQSGTVTSIDIAAFVPLSPSSDVVLSLYDASDVFLDSTTVTAVQPHGILSGTTSGAAALISGESYKIVAEGSGDFGQGAIWNFNNIGQTLPHESSMDGGANWFPETVGAAGVFRVNAVPIPAAAWLFGSALIGLVGLKRKRTDRQ